MAGAEFEAAEVRHTVGPEARSAAVKTVEVVDAVALVEAVAAAALAEVVAAAVLVVSAAAAAVVAVAAVTSEAHSVEPAVTVAAA